MVWEIVSAFSVSAAISFLVFLPILLIFAKRRRSSSSRSAAARPAADQHQVSRDEEVDFKKRNIVKEKDPVHHEPGVRDQLLPSAPPAAEVFQNEDHREVRSVYPKLDGIEDKYIAIL